MNIKVNISIIRFNVFIVEFNYFKLLFDENSLNFLLVVQFFGNKMMFDYLIFNMFKIINRIRYNYKEWKN